MATTMPIETRTCPVPCTGRNEPVGTVGPDAHQQLLESQHLNPVVGLRMCACNSPRAIEELRH